MQREFAFHVRREKGSAKKDYKQKALHPLLSPQRGEERYREKKSPLSLTLPRVEGELPRKAKSIKNSASTLGRRQKCVFALIFLLKMWGV